MRSLRKGDMNAMEEALGKANDRIRELEEAMLQIAAFTNGHGDVAGIVCKLARKALFGTDHLPPAKPPEGEKLEPMGMPQPNPYFKP